VLLSYSLSSFVDDEDDTLSQQGTESTGIILSLSLLLLLLVINEYEIRKKKKKKLLMLQRV
jgi:hypothetical protein